MQVIVKCSRMSIQTVLQLIHGKFEMKCVMEVITTPKYVDGMEATVKSSTQSIPTARRLIFQNGLEMDVVTKANMIPQNVDGTEAIVFL